MLGLGVLVPHWLGGRFGGLGLMSAKLGVLMLENNP